MIIVRIAGFTINAKFQQTSQHVNYLQITSTKKQFNSKSSMEISTGKKT